MDVEWEDDSFPLPSGVIHVHATSSESECTYGIQHNEYMVHISNNA